MRAYGFDLLAFCRWLRDGDIELAAVTTDVLLRFLAACRDARVAGRPGPNVVALDGSRLDRYAATTINHRLIAISGLFAFRAMRDPDMPSPVPHGREARRAAAGERNGLLAHAARRPRQRSALRLREPRRLPRALDQQQAAELLASFRTWRDRAIAGLMLYCGLRSAEVLGLDVTGVDIGGRWVQVTGKGNRERRVPLDADVAAVIQTYLLAERPETASTRLFFVAKGPAPGAAADRGGAAPGLPLPPGDRRRPGREPARAAAYVRHRAGRGRGGPGGDAGSARPCPCRHLSPVYPPGPGAREGGIRCGS